MCVGFKPGAEEWRAQKDPLSYVVCSQRPFTLSFDPQKVFYKID